MTLDPTKLAELKRLNPFVAEDLAQLAVYTPELIAAAEERERLLDALDRGRRFERAYQESLGATPTQTQYERLDSLQSAFLDAYLDIFAASEQPRPEGGGA